MRFWPGPLTLVLPRAAVIPDLVTGGRETVAIRVPAVPVARGLILSACQPLAAPSANRSNRVSPTRAEHVLADLDGRIELILDSGPTTLGLESTVLDLTSTPLRILRPGPIRPEEIEECLGGNYPVYTTRQDLARSGEDSAPSPGMLSVHYAPSCPAVRVDAVEQLGKIAWPAKAAVVLLGVSGSLALPEEVLLFKLEDPEEAARRLYATLHECDALGVDLLVVVMPPDQPRWAALRDRLLRATRPATAETGEALARALDPSGP
jgi:L-threonylcarbamoyladenylate synthase